MVTWGELMSEDISIDEALKRGIEAHKVGKFEEADRYYTAILKSQPKHPDANHNMGVLAVGIGKVEEALQFFKTSLEVNPSIEQFWLSFIDALIKLEKFSDAEKVLGHARVNGFTGEAFEDLHNRIGRSDEIFDKAIIEVTDPPQDQLKPLIDFYNGFNNFWSFNIFEFF